MKIVILSCFFLCAFSLAVFGESYRRTTDDMYRESFAEEWHEHMMNNPAQIRASQYRKLTETCDEHHNCKSESHESGTKPFAYVPLWQ